MKEDLFPEDIREAANKMGSDWIKGEEFDGEGLVLQLQKKMEKIKSNNPKYGATEKDFLVKNEILEIGELLRFFFVTSDGQERKFDTKSSPFFIGFKQCEETGVGDWVKISRSGKGDKTRYVVEKWEKPDPLVKPKKAKQPEYPDEVNPDDVPF